MVKFIPCLALLLICIFIFGCSGLRPQTDLLLDSRAMTVSLKAKAQNQSIKSSKGIGTVQIHTRDHTRTFKIAWAATQRNQIRITFLLSGHPVETIISNGDAIECYSHTGAHKKYIILSKNPNLKKYLGISVKLSELVQILLGRLPIEDFDDAYFKPADPKKATVILTKQFRPFSQQITLGKMQNIVQIQSLDNLGNINYSMHISNRKMIDSKKVPHNIHMIDQQNNRLVFKIVSFTPNPLLKAHVFQLTESGS